MTMTTLDTTGTRIARDLVLLLARIGLGIIMIAHAKLEWDFAGGSLAGVGQLFGQSGIPLPAITGPANVLFEFVGGAAMIIGLAVPIVGVLMALNMVGAFSMDHNGPELAITIALLSLVLAVIGSGRFGVDDVIIPRLRRRAGATAGR
jgi:putative oxidoreductase